MIIGCKRCPRLLEHCQQVARVKRKAYREETYWGKPVPGFGDPNARIWILGLAPGAHGANRTGRVFTGDRSGQWLYRALFEMGWASQPESHGLDDGLSLHDVYISCAVRCAPPDNRPTPQEIAHCSTYLSEERNLLPRVQVILCLGALAYEQACRLLQVTQPKRFSHGLELVHSSGTTLLCSYHPSQQNTFTGRLKPEAWSEIFQRARALIGL